MKKYLCEYHNYIKKILETEGNHDYKQILDYHKSQIDFFQHERFIHLIVMSLFAILFVMTVFAAAISNEIQLIILALLFLVLLIPYIKHYFFLENGVQALYTDYNVLYEKCYGVNYKNI